MMKDRRDAGTRDPMLYRLNQWKEKSISFSLHAASRQQLLFVAFSLAIGFVLTPSFLTETPSYHVGDIAETNIKASHAFLMLDEKATKQKRREAQLSIPPVFDFHENVLQTVEKRIHETFAAARQRLDELDRQWRASSDGGETGPSAERGSPKYYPPVITKTGLKNFIEKRLGFELSASTYRDLLAHRFDESFEKGLMAILQPVYTKGILGSRVYPGLGESPAATKEKGGIILRKLPSMEEERLENASDFLTLQQAEKLLSETAARWSATPFHVKSLVEMARHLIGPNVFFDQGETDLRRRRAAEAVKPVYIRIKKNEMIVREGSPIGPEELKKLQAYLLNGENDFGESSFVVASLLAAFILWIFVGVAVRHIATSSLKAKDYFFLGIILVVFLSLVRFSEWVSSFTGTPSSLFDQFSLFCGVPLSAGTMLTSIFFGPSMAILFAAALSVFTSVLVANHLLAFLLTFFGSVVGAHTVASCRNRLVPIRGGLLIGATNGMLLVLFSFFQGQWQVGVTLINASLGFLGGVLSGILATGLTPLAETLFGYTTDIRLLELASMDQPLLQELMIQAPGTYHHSLIVANMVESAALAIGANSLLAKVAGYYHDIGKIKKPLYFIENQAGCENRHEKLAPSMSSLILISHVKEGVELARKHRLGSPIADIISQHHGTSLIAYFYQKALEAREKAQTSKGAELPPIDIQDYRYPGPKPQTREAGLVMLADVVEAACRTLKDPTPARIQGLVNRLINNVFADGQLDECELTLKDLHQIAKRFNQILATVHHKRIEYPESSQGSGRGDSHGHDSHRQSSKQDRDRPSKNGKGGRTDIKRLGLH